MWLEAELEAATYKDGLGHTVDPLIRPIIATFNRIGLRTSASCEGHPHKAHGTPYPWVDFDDEAECGRQLIELLSLFYTTRHTQYGQMLVPFKFGSWTRLASLETAHIPHDIDKSTLDATAHTVYLAEMKAFSTFLREQATRPK